MAKFKPAGKKKKDTAPKGGVPCVIFLISGMILFLLLLYAVMKSFSA
ncbi:MAG: hypothetical protein IT158_03870 [Bryobacterales bacterium]|nr:hypothetical protein [Bryobacterales bacterium]